MKNDKFCVSKTLSYLVALVVAVVGAFYVMNYVNTQKLSSNTQAAPRASYMGTSCPSENICHSLLQTDGTRKKTGAICKLVDGKKQWAVDTSGTCLQEVCMYGNKNVMLGASTGYDVTGDGCVVNASNNSNVGVKCVKGYVSAVNDLKTCPKSAPAARGCFYGSQDVDANTTNNTGKYRVSTDDCVVEYNGATVVGMTGYKCTTNATTGSRLSVRVNDASDTCYKGPVARSSCTINGKAVNENPGYDMNGSCIRLNGRNTGLKCDVSTNWRNVTNKVDCPPESAATARTQCTFNNRPVIDFTGYSVANNGCIQLNSRNTGLKCDAGTAWKNVIDLANCSPQAATCDTSGNTKCGNFAYGSCVNAGSGTYYKCECYGTYSAPRLNTTTPYDNANCT